MSGYSRSLIEASLDPLVTISVDGMITDVNEASILATGIEKEKLIGTSFSNYFTEPEKAQQGYQEAFEKALSETSTQNSPWYVIPSDKKKTARLIISQLVLHEIKKLHVEFPEMPADQKAGLGKIREELLGEK